MCMRAFTAVAAFMQEIQRENLEDKRFSEEVNKKESSLSLAYSIFFDKNDTSKIWIFYTGLIIFAPFD